jgi:hypothetical protein
MKKQITQDQQEIISDVLAEMTEHPIAQRTGMKLTAREVRAWISYYADEEVASDPVIVAGVLDGFNNKNNR